MPWDLKAATSWRRRSRRKRGRLVGRFWAVEARVEHGDKRGRTMGFPTANMHLGHCFQPAFGVYAVRVRLADGAVHDGVANFGIRPMFELPTPLLEVHLFDFSGDLYGQPVAVELVAYLRGEMKLANLEALKVRIAADCADARRALAQALAQSGTSP